MQLDHRLQAIADFVETGARVADVGTDHGYLAVYLVEAGRAASVIASDKNEGPLKAAARAVEEHGLAEKITLRLGDGLKPLAAGEVDTICIAGMGGALMRDILAASPEILAGARALILQPMNAADTLRGWLYDHGFYIEDEALAKEEGRLYEIIKAVPGSRPRPSAIELLLGPVLLAKKPALFGRHLEELLFSAQKVARGMEKSERAKESAKYRETLAVIEALERRLSN